MSFQKDVYSFIERVNQFMFDQKAKDEAIQQYKVLIDQQVKQIDKLMDRLMARDIQELKTFTLPEGQVELKYDPRADEGLAGEIVEMEEESGSTGTD